MKLKATFLFVLMLNLTFGFAQNEECMTKLSLMTENAKNKKYDIAYPEFMQLRKECPKYNRAIYKYGEKILKHKIKNSAGEEKKNFIFDLIKMYEERAVYFASKTPKGEYDAKKTQLKYDNKKLLNSTESDLYTAFDNAFKTDAASFKNPKSLYVYFKLIVNLYDKKEKTAAELFNKYDDVAEKIEEEVAKSSAKLNVITTKEEAGQELTRKEKKYKKYYTQVLTAFGKIEGSINKELGDRANCATLIPLYKKDFEANKENTVWLKRAVSRMFSKECTNDALYEKLVKAYDSSSPSADTKYFVATILLKKNKESEAIKYFKQSFDLEQESFKKAKLATRIGNILKKKGRYGQARNYFRQALKFNPSQKTPHLYIAEMYSKSANTCGTDNFSKRSVFWLAANEAAKAGKKGSKYAANYKAKAPTKSEIFAKGNGGQSIKIGCWIGLNVTVPKI